MTWLRRLFGIVLFAALLVGGWRFRAGNESTVDVSFVLGSVPGVPLWLALGFAFALGALAIALPFTWWLARSGLLVRRYRRAVQKLESEVHELRTLPLASEAPPRGAGGGG